MAKVALVTGANRGIGKEIAIELVRDHGFVVYAAARDPSEVGRRENIIPVELDVTDEAEIEAARALIESEQGLLDALVNNAGIYGDPDGAESYDLDRAHEVLEVNTFGPWRMIQEFLPLMRRSAAPRIVNVSSGAGQLAEMNGGRTAYRLSKAALNALTRNLASEEAGTRLKVNTMCPGWVRTDMGGMGAPRSVEEGADTAIWLATLPEDGPTGGFFRNRRPIPW